jgi:hypothetical protein
MWRWNFRFAIVPAQVSDNDKKTIFPMRRFDFLHFTTCGFRK